jgi:UDP-N-acetylmuramate dehydrogenase
VVLSVTFGLSASPLSEPVRYTELAAALGVAPGERVTTGEARSAVLKLRAAKGMLVNPDDPDSRSAGSFFTNPVLDAGQLAELEAAVRARYGADVRVPSFPGAAGQVKVSAAWLIERAGFHKGYPGQASGYPGEAGGYAGRVGRARLSAKHTLALVNPGGATTADLIVLAREVRDGVRDAFGVTLAPEPVLVGVTL